MAVLTNNKKQWGYSVGGSGGTDATTVTSGDVYVKRLLLVAGASTNTIAVTDVAGQTLVSWVAPASKHEVVEVGAKIKGLIVTCNSTASVCNIIVE